MNFLETLHHERQRSKNALLQQQPLVVPPESARLSLDDYRQDILARKVPAPTQYQLETACLAALSNNYLSGAKKLGQYLAPTIVPGLPAEIAALKDHPDMSYPFLKIYLVDFDGQWSADGYLGHYLPEEINSLRVLVDPTQERIRQAIDRGSIPVSILRDLLRACHALCKLVWEDAVQSIMLTELDVIKLHRDFSLRQKRLLRGPATGG